uniref:Apt1 domain-containing protein n=1 Tax=Haemonchus placei TaxID=6290 RepID=A0A0N4W7W2_HAEPC
LRGVVASQAERIRQLEQQVENMERDLCVCREAYDLLEFQILENEQNNKCSVSAFFRYWGTAFELQIEKLGVCQKVEFVRAKAVLGAPADANGGIILHEYEVLLPILIVPKRKESMADYNSITGRFKLADNQA